MRREPVDRPELLRRPPVRDRRTGPASTTTAPRCGSSGRAPVERLGPLRLRATATATGPRSTPAATSSRTWSRARRPAPPTPATPSPPRSCGPRTATGVSARRLRRPGRELRGVRALHGPDHVRGPARVHPGADGDLEAHLHLRGDESRLTRDVAIARGERKIDLSACGTRRTPAGRRNRCRGKRATLVGSRRANGSSARRPRRDRGLGGKDRIKGRGGNDLICGKGGKDKISGGPGRYQDEDQGASRRRGRRQGQGGRRHDRISGGGGNDKLRGDGGTDVLRGGKGRDRCVVNGGRDRLRSCERPRPAQQPV